MLYNLREYHRPTDIDEAIRLLRRKDVCTAILAGGIGVIGQGDPEIEAVVDLSDLGLDFIEHDGGVLRLGAMVRLQTIVEELSDVADGLLSDAARRMAGWHVRNAATLGGVLFSGSIHNPLSVALAALRARVRIHWQAGEVPFWSDLANQVRLKRLQGQIMTAVTINLPEGIGTGYEQVARTPSDSPIVCAAAVVSPSGAGEFIAHIAVGGMLHDLALVSTTIPGDNPTLGVEMAMNDIVRDNAAETVFLSNYLGSAEYRRSVAPILARRALLTALDRAGDALGKGSGGSKVTEP